MRKVLLFAGMLAASMAAGAATAYSVARATEKGEAYAAPSTEFASNVGTHFTSYEPGSYPDLTYAAENAVKGVVNIVNTQEVENDYYSGGGGFEQFFEFFGMPRGYQQQPQQPRERKRKRHETARNAERQPFVRREGDRDRPDDRRGAH